jgi:hypothetical protein
MQEHGGYRVPGANGTFSLALHYLPYDPRACVLLGAELGCRLGDIGRPFTVVNASGSDTLTVVREGISVPFEIPEGDCEARGFTL